MYAGKLLKYTKSGGGLDSLHIYEAGGWIRLNNIMNRHQERTGASGLVLPCA